MAKPAQTTELDDARRIIGMLKTVTNPRNYMEIFNITIEDIKRYKKILDERPVTTKPIFSENVED